MHTRYIVKLAIQLGKAPATVYLTQHGTWTDDHTDAYVFDSMTGAILASLPYEGAIVELVNVKA